MIPHSEHDIWFRILDALRGSGRRSTLHLKACNHVCASWHKYLQPHLWSSIAIDYGFAPPAAEDVLLLQHFSHRTRKLHLRNCMASTEPSNADVGFNFFPATFRFITALDLHNIWFSNFQELCISFLAMSTTLETLSLVDCGIGAIHDILDNLSEHSSTKTTIVPPHALTLRKLYVESRSYDLFNSFFLQWFALSSNLDYLKILQIHLACSDYTCLHPFRILLENPQCKIEELSIFSLSPSARPSGYCA
jgi:hypothetical protein